MGDPPLSPREKAAMFERKAAAEAAQARAASPRSPRAEPPPKEIQPGSPRAAMTAHFEAHIAEQNRKPAVKKSWQTSAGGKADPLAQNHNRYKKTTTFDEPPPAAKSLSDLP